MRKRYENFNFQLFFSTSALYLTFRQNCWPTQVQREKIYQPCAFGQNECRICARREIIYRIMCFKFVFRSFNVYSRSPNDTALSNAFNSVISIILCISCCRTRQAPGYFRGAVGKQGNRCLKKKYAKSPISQFWLSKFSINFFRQSSLRDCIPCIFSR